MSIPIPGMPPLTGTGTLSQLLNYAKNVASVASKNAATNLQSSNMRSLTQYTKQTNIMARTYIEESVLRDEICPSLVGVLNQMYVGYVLSALNIDAICANGQTVRQMLEVVSSESFDIIKAIDDYFGKNNYTFSNEDGLVDLEPNTQRLPVGRLIELTLTGAVALGSYSKDVSNGNSIGSSITTNHEETSSTMATPSKEQPKDANGNPIPGIALKEVKTTHSVTDGGSTTTTQSTDHREGEKNGWSESTYNFKAYLYVQLIPYVLKPEVVNGYIGANFNPPLSRRWMQLRAGEISFWNDFIFTRDLIKKQAEALKKDRSGVIGEMMSKNRNKLWRWFLGLTGFRPVSHNTANTIMICSKESFMKACSENAINFENFTQRQRYFNKTWSMIICVVDRTYNLVDMYLNGLDFKGTYTYELLNKVGTKGQDAFNLKEIMSAFSQGIAPTPRF